MKKTLKILKIITYIFFSIILIIGSSLVISKVVFKETLPKFLGFSTAIIFSGSMADTIVVDDMPIYYKQNDYEINDIIIFKKNTSLVTHRIVDKTDEGLFITKGDANNSVDDDSLSLDMIEGKVIFVIPSGGKVVDFFRTPFGMLVVIVSIFTIVGISKMINKFLDKKGGNHNVQT